MESSLRRQTAPDGSAAAERDTDDDFIFHLSEVIVGKDADV